MQIERLPFLEAKLDGLHDGINDLKVLMAGKQAKSHSLLGKFGSPLELAKLGLLVGTLFAGFFWAKPSHSELKAVVKELATEMDAK